MDKRKTVKNNIVKRLYLLRVVMMMTMRTKALQVDVYTVFLSGSSLPRSYGILYHTFSGRTTVVACIARSTTTRRIHYPLEVYMYISGWVWWGGSSNDDAALAAVTVAARRRASRCYIVILRTICEIASYSERKNCEILTIYTYIYLQSSCAKGSSQ